jgi:predicted dithiol-disulfide oxidoreductase (DUF899 family)
MTEQIHDQAYPNETPEYRAARNSLLKAEMDLRKAHEAVNVQRRALPPGGELKEDYVFAEGFEGKPTKFSELFKPGKDTLLVYNFMYGPAMKAACPACTSIIDSLQGAAEHVEQHVSLAIVARSPIARILEFARSRNWEDTRFLSSANNNYNVDYFGESENGDQWPMLNVFTKRDGKIYHTWGTELRFAPHEPGQDERHVDSIWPVWNLYDMTPEGRLQRYPKLSYE